MAAGTLLPARPDRGKTVNRASGDWYADEALWIETYPFMFPESSFEAAIEQVDQIIELSGCQQGSLLDLCCGPGRFAVPFVKRGFAVTGVDLTPFLLEKAKAYAATEGVDIEFVQTDMRQFERSDAFELAISMLTSFGYFDDEEENLHVLKNIYASLKPGGVFVFDTNGKEIIAKIYEETYSQELPGGGLIVQRRGVINDWSQMENEWMLIKGEQITSFRLRHWIYSGREIKELLAAAGFSTIELYGDLAGKPYGPDAVRMIAVARKA
jgi:SAM-dependent methyltransferase